MATAATSLLGLALPVTGELSGTWGDTVNVSITALLDTAVAGTTTLSSDADVTLTTTTLAANQARQAIILWTAGGTVTRTITVPAQSKSYIVINKTSSSQSIKIVGAGPTTGVTIVAGTAAFVVWNGVDFVTASVTSTTGILPVANGGTGLSSGTSGGVLAYTATGTLASSTALAASALVIGGGAGAAPSTTTTGTGVVTALGVNTGTAGAFVVNGGALGSPSTAGTMPAFTLGGTVSGGGNQINNVIIGTTTPLAGAFTTLSATGLLSTTAGYQFRGADATAYEVLRFVGGTNNPGLFGKVTEATKKVVLDASGSVGGATLDLSADATVALTISSTGAAVTGTLSATGMISKGTTTGAPSTGDDLVLQTTGYTGITLFGGAADASTVYFRNQAAPTVERGYLQYDFATSLMTSGSNTAVTGTLSSTLGATIQGLTVGLGAGAVATNTAVGYQALTTNSTGATNVAVGYQSGQFITTGSDNVSIGVNALRSTAITGTGSNNTAIGRDALVANTTASNNTAVGYQAAYTGTTATEVVAIGKGALYANTVNYGTAVGFHALNANTTGAANAAFGAYALSTNTTGAGNSAFGALGFGLSDSALQANTTGSYNSAFGLGALAKNTTASNNTAVGYQSLYTSNGTGNQGQVAIGYQAGYSNTTGFVTAFGNQASFAQTTGGGNSAFGNQAMRSTTTGSANTAIGETALYSNTTASNNTAVGYQAGYTNTTGGNNTNIGYQAGYTNPSSGTNVFVGYQAGYAFNAVGQNSANAFIGYSAGSSVTSGLKNTILGSYSGNQGGLDIRTASNYIVLSDGDGNPLISTNSTRSVALNGAVPQTGTGITFPATQSASTNANTLDDYEEGTFTLASNFTITGALTQSNAYVKIGRQVTLSYNFNAATSIVCTAGSSFLNVPPFETAYDGTCLAANLATDLGLGVGVVENSLGATYIYPPSFTSGANQQISVTTTYFV